MLTTVIDRLTSLVSKYFVIGAFLPVLMFAFLTGTIFYHDSKWFREWARPEMSQTGTAKTFDAVALLIGIAIIAYLLSTINTFLREILEGKHLLPIWNPLLQLFQARQEKKLAKLNEEYATARNERALIGQQKQKWQEQLSTAAEAGIKQKPGSTAYTAPIAILEQLRTLRSSAKPVTSAQLMSAVNTLSTALTANDESVADTATGRPLLREDRFDLLSLIEYAQDSWASRELRAFNEQQASFGLPHVAPTAMGNVGLSIQSYGITRYQLNLDKFWGSLQLILQSDKEFYTQLQDAKVQLDFLVSCSWLCCLATVCCVPVLLVRGHSPVVFLLVAIGGPCASYFFYSLAVRNYMGFAELVRTAVDLYRFKLLQALHVALPATVRDERATWATLQRLFYSGSEGIELSLQHNVQVGALKVQ
jgi:hypothetical protein